MTRTLTYSIANGSIERLSQSQTHAYMDSALQELERYTDIKFRKLSAGGMYKFSFKDEWNMQVPALGNAYKNGVIHIAARTARDRWRMDLPFRRTLQTVTQHEPVAHLPPYNLGHTSVNPGILGISANSPGPLPNEVLMMQSKTGRPKKIFYPIDRAIMAQRKRAEGELDKQFIALKTERDEMIKDAKDLPNDQITDAWKRIHAKHRQVMAVLNKIIYYNKAWWAANNHWRGIPKAHYISSTAANSVTAAESFFLTEASIDFNDPLYSGKISAYIDEDGEE